MSCCDRPATSPARSFASSMSTPPIPAPLDKASCVTLVTHALADARARGDPVTIDLSHQRIASIPAEVLELVKNEIERLALAHNQLTTFSDEFASLPRLRYLNLRSNFLREFPAALTRLPSLEILDVSRNRLRALPADFGTLVNLKVLSMSKNKITTLPTYIGDMHDLKILKLDHNPLSFPPAAVLDTDGEETDRDAWLENLKRFLRAGSSGSENDFSSAAGTLVGRPSAENLFEDAGYGNGETIKPLKGGGGGGGGMPGEEPTITPFRETPGMAAKKASMGAGRRPPKQLLQSLPMALLPAALKSPAPLQPLPPTPTERSRSNSESTILNTRRMGMVGTRGKHADQQHHHHHQQQQLRTVDEQQLQLQKTKHQRGYSHDSAVVRGGGGGGSPPDRPLPCFRRLSSLPEHKRSSQSVSSARVGEAARGILYAMSTLQGPIEEFVQSLAPGAAADGGTFDTALHSANSRIGALVSALEAFEENDEEAAVVDACHSCVAAFRQVLGLLRDVGGAGCQDKRYVRTLLLMAYGSYIEIQNSYETLRPLLGVEQQQQQQPPATARIYAPPRLKNNNGSVVSLPSTPRQDVFMLQPPPTPGLAVVVVDGGFDNDEPLYGKFLAATNAATTTLPVIEREIKAAAGSVQNPSVALKLREVATLCVTGTEAARRLGMVKWEAVREGDVGERRRFWEETNKFTNLVINIAELIKSITQDHPFPKPTLIAVGTVVRPTKDLYILMNGSAFRHQQQQYAAATPLSAALGVAMQATVPQMGGYMTGRSATLVGQMGMGDMGAFGKAPVRLS